MFIYERFLSLFFLRLSIVLLFPSETSATTILSTATVPTTTTTIQMTTTSDWDICSPSQPQSLYTREIHNNNPHFSIFRGTADETSVLLMPSPNGGVLTDGPTQFTISLTPARDSNIIVKFLLLGGDSATFQYVQLDGTVSQPYAVSLGFLLFPFLIFIVSRFFIRDSQMSITNRLVNPVN